MKEFDLQEYLSDLAQICAIDSGRGNSAGNHAVLDFFEQRYQALNLHTQRRFEAGNTDSPMLVVRNSEEEEIDVLLLAHMDTVFADGTAAEWPMTVDENGIGHAPGCVDCKGGCLSVYYLLRAMLEEGTCRFRFCVILNSDEERGSHHSQAVIEEMARKSKLCLVFEPGRANDEFVGTRKGGANFDLQCHGIAAHSGVEPEKGASAILELAQWIPEIYKLTDYKAGTTVNVAYFNGGMRGGSVPDYAECAVAMRCLDPAVPGRLQTLLERLQKNPFDPRTSMEIIPKPCRPLMLPGAATEQIFDVLREAGRELDQTVEIITTGGGSDGNFTAALGVPTLDGCGPCGGSLHTRDEFLKTGSVLPRLEIMERLLMKLFP